MTAVMKNSAGVRGGVVGGFIIREISGMVSWASSAV
jgi:hypothetical protein